MQKSQTALARNYFSCAELPENSAALMLFAHFRLLSTVFLFSQVSALIFYGRKRCAFATTHSCYTLFA